MAGDGMLSGQVVLGRVAPPAPPTDPNQGWPEPVSSMMGAPPLYIPGFAYTARDIRWESQRLKFRIDWFEPWQSWCALQTSHHVQPQGGASYFTCSRPEDEPACCGQGTCPAGINCAHASQCSAPYACSCDPGGANCYCGGYGVCDCTTAGCNAVTAWPTSNYAQPKHPPAPVAHAFDLAVRGTGRGQGSVSFNLRGSVGNFNVRLDRTIE
jgi:hypothetical protein